MALTPRQRRFASEYVLDYNATQAAIRSGFEGRSAGETGSSYLKIPAVRQLVDQLEQEIDSGLKIQLGKIRKKWLREIVAIAFADYDRFATMDHGRLRILDTAERPPGSGRLIQSIRCVETKYGMSTEVKLHPKMPALELLGKYAGLLVEKHEHTGEGGGPVKHVAVTVSADEWAKMLALKQEGQKPERLEDLDLE